MSADNMEYDEDAVIVVLTDDDGNDLELEYVDRISYQGSDYAVMIPTENDDDNDSDEAADVVILKIEPGSGESDSYTVIDDEKLLNDVFEIFKEKFKDEFEFE